MPPDGEDGVDVAETMEAAEQRGIAASGLEWGRFLLQFFTVVVGYILGSVPPILIWGQTATGYLISVVSSMVVGLLVAWLWLRRDGIVAEAWNLSRPDSWPRALALAAAATGAICAIFLVGGPMLRELGLPAADVESVMRYVTQSPLALVLWITLVAWFAAGLGEELLWRGFLFDRLQRVRGLAGKNGLVVLVQALIFALPHGYQGISGIIMTGSIGLLLGWMRLRTGGNLWPLIIAHAAVDTIMMGLGYADAKGLIATD